MKADLTYREAEVLSTYRFVRDRPDRKIGRPLSTLLIGTELKGFIEDVKSMIGAPDFKTTASLIVKRLAFMAVISLHTMTAFDKRLDSSPENILMIDAFKNGLWLPEFHFLNQEAYVRPTGNREEWREESIRHLFEDNLSTILDALAKETKIPKLILWENISIYVFWLYETILPGMVKERSEEDFSYLLHSAPGRLFGSYNHNPLKRYYDEPVYIESAKSFLRRRKTCCFSYKIKGGNDCKTCPMICKQQKRE